MTRRLALTVSRHAAAEARENLGRGFRSTVLALAAMAATRAATRLLLAEPEARP